MKVNSSISTIDSTASTFHAEIITLKWCSQMPSPGTAFHKQKWMTRLQDWRDWGALSISKGQFMQRGISLKPKNFQYVYINEKNENAHVHKDKREDLLPHTQKQAGLIWTSEPIFLHEKLKTKDASKNFHGVLQDDRMHLTGCFYMFRKET